MPVKIQSSLVPNPKGIIVTQVTTAGHPLDRKDALVCKCQTGTLETGAQTVLQPRVPQVTSHLIPLQTGAITSLSLSEVWQIKPRNGNQALRNYYSKGCISTRRIDLSETPQSLQYEIGYRRGSRKHANTNTSAPLIQQAATG